CEPPAAIVPEKAPLNPLGKLMLLTVSTELPVLLIVKFLCADKPTVTEPKARLPLSETMRVGARVTTAKVEKWPVTPTKRTVVGVAVLPSGSGLPAASRRVMVMLWSATGGWPEATTAKAL